MSELTILYEDAHLVICLKPVGVLSEDSEKGRCMPQLLREHYRAQGKVVQIDVTEEGEPEEVSARIAAAVRAYCEK